MAMLRNALLLWKNRRSYKGTTLQSRLTLFFSLIVCSIILLFTLLLLVFGITGSEWQTVQRYFESELTYVSDAVETDFGNLSATGIQLAQKLSRSGDVFFEENNVTAAQLPDRRDAAELLLETQMATLISTAEHNACGGVFVILDSSSSTEVNVQDKNTGFFLKKTQPVSSASFETKHYCLRGPASLAREHGIELMGQWKMEYDADELDFFRSVIQTARENPDLPLSRLYYWSNRVRLNDNSEKGLLLCVPLRSLDGTVWGVCGIEVSDRVFKQLYSPKESEYPGVFAIIAPRSEKILYSNLGLIAGNTYLTGNQMNEELTFTGLENGFPCFHGKDENYGGLTKNIHLYSSESPYNEEIWEVATLMPESFLNDAVRGSSVYLFFIVAGLLVLSLAASVIVSKRYLHPIKQGLSSIHERDFETSTEKFGILEIDNLLEDLARDIRAHEEEMQRLTHEKQSAELQYKNAQTQIERLTDRRKQDIDPEEYALFLENLKKLTATERKIFNLYLAGRTTEEILETQQIKDNTLKYHNRNIYSKLGVTSRKQLLTYAAIMQQEKESGI